MIQRFVGRDDSLTYKSLPRNHKTFLYYLLNYRDCNVQRSCVKHKFYTCVKVCCVKLLCVKIQFEPGCCHNIFYIYFLKILFFILMESCKYFLATDTLKDLN